MKNLLLKLTTLVAVFFVATNICHAEDRVQGLRYVDETGDASKGETKRTKSFNQKGELVGVTTHFQNGQVRNQTYQNGILRLEHETDFKGWTKTTEFNQQGTLLIVTETMRSGKVVVYVNVDCIAPGGMNIELKVGDQLHLLYSQDVGNGSRSDLVTVKQAGIITTLTGKLSTPQNTTPVASGSFEASTKGATEVNVVTTTVTAGFPGPRGKPPIKTQTNRSIKVTVTAAPTVHIVDYSKKPFPSLNSDLKLATGDTITVEVSFKGDVGLFDPFLTPEVVNTDNQKGNVLEALPGAVTRKDANTIEAWKFKSLRKGTAEIRFVNPAGKVMGTVKVTVQ